MTEEHVRCGMCAGDLKYCITTAEYELLLEKICDEMIQFYVGHKTLLD